MDDDDLQSLYNSILYKANSVIWFAKGYPEQGYIAKLR